LRSERDDGIVVVEARKSSREMGRAYGARQARRRTGQMTTAEYLQTPETNEPRELAYGVLRVAESPTVMHQRVVRQLLLALWPFVERERLGEVWCAPLDVILDLDAALVVQPDLLYVARDSATYVSDRLYGPPDLAIEVLSPRPRIGNVEERVGWFARYGVRECWLVSLDRKEVAVLTLGPGGVLKQTVHAGADPIATAVLPGLRLKPIDVLGS
jgi:Uma2 family endonuclease